MSLTLVIGGARSGKSRYAQSIALSLCHNPIYVATSRAWDADHQKRIARHRQDRGDRFRTLECETHLAQLPLAKEVAVIDCLTLWLSNFFSDSDGDVDHCLSAATRELDALPGVGGQLLLVTNEVGQGVIAPTELGRKFCDLQGLVNQHAAALCDNVALMVAGIPLYVKGEAPRGD
jgi:adenosylcobinamide kinase/adenosylcobinamide-phosphate guanylyltransferase